MKFVIRSRAAGFTMVEIAISLAVIAFALVAIIGVLPTGMRVQKDNREETIITQDGIFLLEAIRSGSHGLDDLTNYFDSIIVSNRNNQRAVVYTFGAPSPRTFSTGHDIIGLLSTPKYDLFQPRGVVSNSVMARVRAINGSIVERDPAYRDGAFRYQLTAEVIPLNVFPSEHTNFNVPALSTNEWAWRSNNWLKAINIAFNFYDVRLTLRWPLYERGTDWEVGGNKKVFRTTTDGFLMPTNRFSGRLYFFEPSSFVQLQPGKK